MSSYSKVLTRVAQLIQTDNPEKELKVLTNFQMELSPEMNESQALNCVIHGLIKTYQDYTLDYLWLEYIKESVTENNIKAA